jgi:nucleoside-diphosphate-sugar epimerase
MQIIGNGMIARSLVPYKDKYPDITVFASGVSNSFEVSAQEFNREYDLLNDTVSHCIESDKCIVYFSSGGAIYGNFEKPRTEMSPTFPQSLYGRHKLLCEGIIQQSGADYLILRLPQLVGTNQNSKQLVASLVKQACVGQASIHLYATRDLLDLDDMVLFLLRLFDLEIRNETIVMASGHSVPVIKIFEEIQHVLKTDANITILKRGDRQVYNIEKLKRLIQSETFFTSAYYKAIIQKYAHQLAEYVVREK